MSVSAASKLNILGGLSREPAELASYCGAPRVRLTLVPGGVEIQLTCETVVLRMALDVEGLVVLLRLVDQVFTAVIITDLQSSVLDCVGGRGHPVVPSRHFTGA